MGFDKKNRTGRKGTLPPLKRQAAKNARSKAKKAVAVNLVFPEPQPLPRPQSLSQKELQATIANLVKVHHAGVGKKNWPAVAREIGPIVKADVRLVTRVINKIASGQDATKRKLGGGKPPRIKPGTAKADVLVGTLRSGLGSRHTASKINELGASPGKKPIGG